LAQGIGLTGFFIAFDDQHEVHCVLRWPGVSFGIGC